MKKVVIPIQTTNFLNSPENKILKKSSDNNMTFLKKTSILNSKVLYIPRTDFRKFHAISQSIASFFVSINYSTSQRTHANSL